MTEQQFVEGHYLHKTGMSVPEKLPSHWREFICGGGAAFCNILISYPLNKLIFRQVWNVHLIFVISIWNDCNSTEFKYSVILSTFYCKRIQIIACCSPMNQLHKSVALFITSLDLTYYIVWTMCWDQVGSWNSLSKKCI